MLKVIHAPSLELAKTVKADVTVEAEYGSNVVEGRTLTLAHHQKDGPYSSRESPAPCNNGNAIRRAMDDVERSGWFGADVTVLVSHLDLDTIGGILRVKADVFGSDRELFDRAGFWRLAEFVDLNGPHKRLTADASKEDLEALDAWWAWLRTRPRPTRDALSDVTDEVASAAGILSRIFAGDQDLLAAGKAFRGDEDSVNRASLVDVRGGVVVRVHDTFVNHLYNADDDVCRAVVALNTKFGSVTISLSDPVPGVSCREIVQGLWGPEAGGHDGIAGGPRDSRMGLDDLMAARDAVIKALS